MSEGVDEGGRGGGEVCVCAMKQQHFFLLLFQSTQSLFILIPGLFRLLPHSNRNSATSSRGT